jgi:hypothetical protein
MGDAAGAVPNDGRVFLGTQKLPRGGILYLTTTAEAAEWMKNPDVRRAFLQHFGATARIADRGHSIIVQYVPT